MYPTWTEREVSLLALVLLDKARGLICKGDGAYIIPASQATANKANAPETFEGIVKRSTVRQRNISFSTKRKQKKQSLVTWDIGEEKLNDYTKLEEGIQGNWSTG